MHVIQREGFLAFMKTLVRDFSFHKRFRSFFGTTLDRPVASAFIFLFLLFSTSLFTGCGAISGYVHRVTHESSSTTLTISPLSKAVSLGGTLALDASEGSEPYSFDVYYGNGTVTSSGATGTYQAPVAAGTAVVRVQDSDGNAGYATIEITDAPIIQPSSKSLAVSNKFPFSALSGKAPYTFSLVLGEGSINATTGEFTAGTTAGTAVIRLTDADGRSSEANVTVNAALSFNSKNIYVENDATYTLAAAGGVPPYTFLIASGAGSINKDTGVFTAPSAFGVTAIHVVDSIGNFDLAMVNTTTALSISPTTALIAKNDNLSFSANGGVPPYSYSIVAGGAGSVSAITGQYTAPNFTGSNTIRVTDALGHTSDASVTVTTNLSFSVANVILAVGNTIDVSTIVEGGMIPLTYTVPNSEGSFSGTTYTAPNTPGTYTITVYDSNSPTPNSVSATVLVNSALSLLPATATLAGSTQKSFSASGGVPPYTYSVQSGTGNITSAGLYTAPSMGGSVTLLVTDSKGNTATAALTVEDSLLIIPTAKTLSSAESFTFSASGGSTPYSYSLVSGSGSINSSSGLYTAPGSSGLATVRVTDASGNTKDAQISILSPLSISPPTISLIKNGSITFTASGGAGPYAFSVTTGSGSINSASGVFTAPATAGATTVRVADSLGSSKDATVTIYDGLTISPFTKNLTVNQTFTFSATGGVSPYTYSLVSGVGSISTSGAYSSNSSGTAIVRVTDAAGNTSDATVSVNSALAISPTSKTLGANNSYTFSATGGVPPYAYSVFSGSGTITSAGDYTAPATSTSAVVRVTDSDNNTADATLTVNDVLSVSPASITVSAGGTQNFTPAGGVSPYTYTVVSGGGSFSSNTYTAPSIASGASVFILVTDSLGNTANASITINPITVSIASPNSSTIITNSTAASFPVSGTCSDSGRPVALSATDGAHAPVTATPSCTTGTWSSNLNLSSLNDTSITISANHSNVNSVAAPSATVTLTKDGSLPTISITSPTAGSSVGNSIVVSGACTKSGLISLSTASGTVNAVTSCVSNSYTATLDASSAVDGSLTITANHTDSSGNTATPATVNVTKDSVAPVITAFTVTNSSPTNSTTYNLTFTATGSPAEYCILENSTTAGNCSWQSVALPTTFSVSATNDAKVLTAWVKDAVGNVSTSTNSNSVTLDTQTPTAPSAVGLSAPATSPAIDTTPTFLVSGVSVGDTVAIYTDSACLVGNQKGTATVGTGTTVSVTSSALSEGTYTFYAKRTSAAGNPSACSTANVTYQLDLTPATITNVTASSDGPFKAGDSFSISIQFSKVVDVTGTPVLDLTTTRSGAQATYSSGTGSNILVFNYTVVSPDTTSDLTYTVTTSLLLASGSIKDNAGNDATLTLPTIGAAGSLSANQNIVLDTTAPTSSSISINGGAPYTSSTTTPLTLASTDASSMYITNIAGCGSGGTYEAYATSKATWNLTTSNATNTVYVKFKDLAGNETSCENDTIIHDNIGPNAPTGLSLGSVPASDSATPTISFNASTDNAGGSGVASYQGQVYKAADNTVVATWTALSSGGTITGSAGMLVNGAAYYVKVRAIDTAGNVGTESAASSNWVAVTDPCFSNPAIGAVCSDGTIYAGTFDGGNYRITPSGCDYEPSGTTSSYSTTDFTPTCTGGTDTMTKKWGNSPWYDIPGVETFSTPSQKSSSSYRGDVNTAAIVAITDPSYGGYHPAARYCDKLNFGGYTDWYLPSKSELAYIYCKSKTSGNASYPQEDPNCATYGYGSGSNIITGFDTTGFYYTSTENQEAAAWIQRFSDGFQDYQAWKYSPDLIRCVRRY